MPHRLFTNCILHKIKKKNEEEKKINEFKKNEQHIKLHEGAELLVKCFVFAYTTLGSQR